MTAEPRDDSHLFQLTRATCVELLSTKRVGRLVTAVPQLSVVPVNYTSTRDAILFRCAPGPKAKALDGAVVLFEVDMIDDRTRSGWSVVVRGTARDVTTAADDVEAVHVDVDTWAPRGKRRRIAIAIEDITGRVLRGGVDDAWIDDRGYL